ncbi:MAG: exosortase W [Deltaproteobacteria bacterium]|nr:exosortase W [Deltaproteobacteria bacterium]
MTDNPVTAETMEMRQTFLGRLPDQKLLLTFALLTIAVAFLYGPAFKWLVDQWWNDRVYSHGFIVPFISLYLVWIKREHLSTLELNPRMIWGGIILLASGFLLLVGRVGAVAQAEALSLLLFFPGLVLFSWGWTYLKALVLPLLYLQFMVPWMDLFLDRIQWPFQLISAHIAVGLLRIAGYTVFRNSTYIQLPEVTLEVARECSGIAFLISVIAIGLPLVYLTQRSWWRGSVVLILGCLITVLANGLRVAIAGFMGSHYGPDMLHGPGHIFRGWFVAQVGWIAVFIVNWAVYKIQLKPGLRLYEKWKQDQQETKARLSQENLPQKKWNVSAVFILLVMFGFGLYLYGFAMPRPIPMKQEPDSFPYKIGSWSGKDSRWIDGSEIFMGVDIEIYRTYVDPFGKKIHLYLGYFESQDADSRLISYHDEPLYEYVRQIQTGSEIGRPQLVNHLSIRINNNTYEALFWYRFPSGDLTGRYNAKLKAITDALFFRHNNAAVILMATPLNFEGQNNAISDDLKSFIISLNPILNQYLP